MNRRHFLASTAALPLATALPALPAFADGHATALPDAQTFSIGDIKVTALSDGALRIAPDVLSGISPEEYADLVASNFRDPETYRTPVSGFLIEAGGAKMLVDAGTGSIMGPDLGRFMGNLTALGHDPADITTLIATHLHADHVGGAFDGDAATYPNAELVVSEAERAFWSDDAIRQQAGEGAALFFDVAQAALAAYANQLKIVTGEDEIAPGINVVPLPGHTAGHMGVAVTSGSESLLIWADIIHVPPVQFDRPDVTIAFDTDPTLAAQTRAQIMDRAAADRMLIAGSHMDFPGFGYIEKTADSYALVEAQYEYNQ